MWCVKHIRLIKSTTTPSKLPYVFNSTCLTPESKFSIWIGYWG